MFSILYGCKIEPCIIVYSIYKDRNNAVSAIVGYDPQICEKDLGPTSNDIVNKFMESHTLFSQKYKYLNICWPAFDQPGFLVAVFKFKHERVVEILPSITFYPK